MAKRKRKRNYRAEYAGGIAKYPGISRAIVRGHPPEGVIGVSLAAKLRVPIGTEIEDISIRDQFPKHPWERKGEDPRVIKEELLSQGFSPADLRGIDYVDQESFVIAMRSYGYTFREAFDLYFGY